MSKQNCKRAAALLTITAVLVTFIFQTSLTTAQVRSKTATQRNLTRSANVISTTAALLKETSEIRQLPILHPIKSGTKSSAEIERMIIKNFNEELSAEDVRGAELALKKLGLVPKDFNYRSFVVKLLTEQIAGFYDPKVKEFYLADWVPVSGQKPVMAHELTHALQDQHFDLERFDKWPKTESDSRLAIAALVEGDAMMVMSQYILKNPLVALKADAISGKGKSDELDKAPRALRESLAFPYLQGMEWAAQLYRRAGGWEAISLAFKSLPQSTEQIIHIEKYMNGEAPIKIELADLSKHLGQGWKRVDYDVNGEWGYYLILADFVDSNKEAKKAAAGWGGDRYAVYANNNNEVLFTTLTAWDSDRDAKEFFDSYARRTNKRYGSQTQTGKASQDVVQASYWKTNEGQVVLMRNASRVLIVEGVPEGVSSESIVQKIWSGK